VLWAAYTISFVILYLLPGDPVELMLNGGGSGTGAVIDPHQLQVLRHQLGFDKPTWQQYLILLGRAVHGNFGHSMQSGDTVAHAILQAFPQTLLLTVSATGLALVLGTVFALTLAAKTGPLHGLLMSLPALGVSVPVFWVGFLFIEAFSFQLRWFPAVGNNGVSSLVLPALTLAIPSSATIAQLLARHISWNLEQPFSAVIRAKGAGELRLWLGHALRNACLPVVTIIGMTVGNMLAGSVIVETVFGRAGIGQLVEQSVKAKDIPMVQGLVVLAAIVFVIVNLLVDLAYPLLDPRVRTVASLR